MRKVYSFIYLLLYVTMYSQGQVYVPGSHTDWDLDVANQAILKSNLGGVDNYYGITIEPSVNDEFKVVQDDWSSVWGGGFWITAYDQKWAPSHGGGNAIWKGSPSNFVHLCIKDPENYSNIDLPIGIMTLSQAPVLIATVNQIGTLKNSTYYANTSQQSINITLSANKSTEEKVYLRYTTDDWLSDSFILATGSGSSFSANIPSQTNGKEVKYYVFTTTLSHVNGNDLDSYPDLMTINYNNNSGNFYNYTVSNPRSKGNGNWNSTVTWLFNEVPNGNDVIISTNDHVTLNTDASISSLTIETDGIFSSSDGTKANRTLSIADGGTISNNGTFTGVDGTVEFAGDGTVSGTIGFNNVGISGGVNFGSSSTINGTLSMKSGSYIDTNPPTYGSGATLNYLIDYSRYLEWSAMSGAGYPHHVIISNNSTLDLGNGGTGVARQCAGDLTIESGSTITLNANPMTKELIVKGDIVNSGTIILSNQPGGDLKVEGDYTDNGSLTHNDRAVFFKGTAEQLINGSSTSIFGYLLVSANANVSIPSTKKVTIEKDLTVDDGSKGVGNLTLKSGATGTASLITNGSVSGVVKVEQYIAAYAKGTPGWHFLSSPVETQPINAFHNPASNDDFYYYDENQGLWINRTAEGGGLNGDFETNFVVGKGYLVGFESTGTKVFSGTLNTVSKESDLLFGYAGVDVDLKGWNLIGNQFAASIDWDDVLTSGSVDDAVYVINGTDGEYLSYVGGAGDLTDGIIPAMQGFFVHATAASQTVTVDPEDRTHLGAAFYKSEDASSNVMRVIVSDDSESSNLYLRFKDEATSSFDSSLDAYKLFGYSNIPQVFAYDENDKFSINSLPSNLEVQEVKLAVKTPITGEYTFSFSDVDMISNYSNIELQDKFLGITTMVNNSTEYTFTSEEGNNEDRFVLHFGATGVNELEKENLQAYISGQNLYILGESGQAQLEVFDIQGKQLVSEQIVLDENFKKALSLPSGIYVVRVQNSQFVKSNKVIIK